MFFVLCLRALGDVDQGLRVRDTFLIKKSLSPPGPAYVDLELTEPELKALGHVTAQWATLEHLIKEYMMLCAKNTRCLVPNDNNSFQMRRRDWERLARSALKDNPGLLAEILAFIKKVGSMEHERHKLIHGLIQWDGSNRRRLKVYSRKNARGRPWTVDAKRIHAFSMKVAALNAEFLNVHGGMQIVPRRLRYERGKPVVANPVQVNPDFVPSGHEPSKAPR